LPDDAEDVTPLSCKVMLLTVPEAPETVIVHCPEAVDPEIETPFPPCEHPSVEEL